MQDEIARRFAELEDSIRIVNGNMERNSIAKREIDKYMQCLNGKKGDAGAMGYQRLKEIYNRLDILLGSSDNYTASDYVEEIIDLRNDIHAMVELEQAHEQCSTCRVGALEHHEICKGCHNWSADNHDKPLLWESNLAKG